MFPAGIGVNQPIQSCVTPSTLPQCEILKGDLLKHQFLLFCAGHLLSLVDLVFSTKKAFRDELLKFRSKPLVPNSAKKGNMGEYGITEILHFALERPIIHSSIHPSIYPPSST